MPNGVGSPADFATTLVLQSAPETRRISCCRPATQACHELGRASAPAELPLVPAEDPAFGNAAPPRVRGRTWTWDLRAGCRHLWRARSDRDGLHRLHSRCLGRRAHRPHQAARLGRARAARRRRRSRSPLARTLPTRGRRRRLGDETPLFELVLGPRLARPASPSWQRSPLPARQSCSSVWSLDPGWRPGVTAPSARAKRPMHARRSGAGQGTFRVFPMAVGPGARRVCRRSSTRGL